MSEAAVVNSFFVFRVFLVGGILLILPRITRRGLVFGVYVGEAFSEGDEARRLMRDWVFNPLADEYAMVADWDDRWRTGGTLDDVIEEAHLDPPHLLAGIERFVNERDRRLAALRAGVDSIGS